MLGCVSTSSTNACASDPHALRECLVTMPCSRRSSPAISNNGPLHGAGVAGFADADADGVTERKWTRMLGEAACEGIVSASTRPSTARIARTFTCSVLRIDGVFRRCRCPPIGGREERRERGGENERGRLVIYDDTRAGAKVAR